MKVTIKGNASLDINFAQLTQALEPFLADVTLIVKPAEPVKSNSFVEYPSKPYPVALAKMLDGSILARVYTSNCIRFFKSSEASQHGVCYRDLFSGEHVGNNQIADSIDAALWLAKQE